MALCDAPSEEQQHGPIEESLAAFSLYSDVADDEALRHLHHAVKSLSWSSSPLLQSPPLQYLTATDASWTSTPILVEDHAELELLSSRSKVPPLHTSNDESRAVPESLPESNGSVRLALANRPSSMIPLRHRGPLVSATPSFRAAVAPSPGGLGGEPNPQVRRFLAELPYRDTAFSSYALFCKHRQSLFSGLPVSRWCLLQYR